MRRRTWALLMLLVGLLLATGGIAGAYAARDAWSDARAGCAGASDEWCGGARTYAAAVGLAFAPIVSVIGMLLVAMGVTVLAFRTPPARPPAGRAS